MAILTKTGELDVDPDKRGNRTYDIGLSCMSEYATNRPEKEFCALAGTWLSRGKNQHHYSQHRRADAVIENSYQSRGRRTVLAENRPC